MKEDDFGDKCAFLFDVIKRYDHYIGTTNFKVGLLMSFIAAIILGLSIRIILTEPSGSGCDYLYYLASASSLFTILLSILTAVNLLRVVFPNTKTDKNDSDNLEGAYSLRFIYDNNNFKNKIYDLLW